MIGNFRKETIRPTSVNHLIEAYVYSQIVFGGTAGLIITAVERRRIPECLANPHLSDSFPGLRAHINIAYISLVPLFTVFFIFSLTSNH